MKENITTSPPIITLPTINALRQFMPERDGQLVYVEEYDSGYVTGGGLFRYRDKGRLMEDRGYSIIGLYNKHWERQLDSPDELNVCHFGAKNDGSADCTNAIRDMQRWSWNGSGSERRVVIRFPPGRFLMSSLDITMLGEIQYFTFSGAPTSLGYTAATTLISDLAPGMMLRLNARYCEISNLCIDGRNAPEDKKEETAPNTRGFYENIKKEGQYLQAKYLWFKRLGGTGLSLIDTLDTSIDHWYANSCEASVIKARWSGIKSWDHNTAIELSNFNVQYCTKEPVLDLPRCTQSFIFNGWIEHSDSPGDLSEGQWVIDGLSLEDCKKEKLKLCSTRYVIKQLNLQSGSGIDSNDSGNTFSWLSEYESGNVRIENHGINLVGSLSVDVITSQKRLDNNTQNPRWFHVGHFFLPTRGDVVSVKLLASAGYNGIRETQKKFSNATGQGMTEIALQKNSSDLLQGTWYGMGASPVKAVQITSVTPARGDLYVQLNAWTTNAVALVETNAKDHYAQGVSFRFNKFFTPLSDEEFSKIPSKITCYEQFWLGNEKVGIGYNAENSLLLSAATADSKEYNDSSLGLSVIINGNTYLLPLLKKK
ncbi:glycosyl hydrolase family 28-related protein [Pantoea sp. y20]